MKTVLAVIKPLLQINALAIACLLVVGAIRGRQAETTLSKEQLIYSPDTHYREIKELNKDKLGQIAKSPPKKTESNQNSLNTVNNFDKSPSQKADISQANRDRKQPLIEATKQTQPMVTNGQAPVAIARELAVNSDRQGGRGEARPFNPQRPSPPAASASQLPPPSPSRQPARQTTPQTSKVETENNWEQSTRYANDIAAGLLVAHKKGQLKYGTKMYRKVQSAIQVLRRGTPLETAAHQAKVPIATLQQLIKWGEIRPGSSVASNNPSPRSDYKTKENGRDESIRQANDIAAGLLVADTKGQINYGTRTYRQVQTAIRLLRRGGTLETAARQSNIATSTLEQLIAWGAARPGSFTENKNQITLAEPTGTP